MIELFKRLFDSDPAREKRKENRLPAENQYGVDFKTEGIVQISGMGDGKDISSNGIRFATQTSLKKGQTVQLCLELPMGFPGASKILVEAEVVRVYRPKGAQRYRVACRFINLQRAPEAETGLKEFVWWLELLERGHNIQHSMASKAA